LPLEIAKRIAEYSEKLTGKKLKTYIIDFLTVYLQYIRAICLFQQAREHLDDADDLLVMDWIEKLKKVDNVIEPIAIASLSLRPIPPNYLEKLGV